MTSRVPVLSGMLIRDAIEDDLPGIFEIYDREVLRGTATFDTTPKTAKERLDWLNSHRDARYPAIVAVEPDHGGTRVLGWASLSPWSPRLAYARSVENSVYVHPTAMRRGLGRTLMLEVLKRGKSAGIAVVIARIVEGNPGSIALHEKLGFQTIGVMRRVGEKFGNILDVRLMDLHLDGAGG